MFSEPFSRVGSNEPQETRLCMPNFETKGMMNLYLRVLALVGAVALGSAALAQSGEQSNGFTPKVPVGDIASSVVTIEYRIPRAFDTYPPATGRSATGFVVDAEKGILMTNRHVVLPGPVVARGVFYNGEELALSPIYRDPVHDLASFASIPKRSSSRK